MDYNNMGHELNWEDEISQESEDMPLLTPGTYRFTVRGFKRGRFNGSEKMGQCPEAIVQIGIYDTASGREYTLNESLKLHTKMEWKLSEFFTSIGQKRKGEPLRMNWNTITGSTGMLELNHRTYNGNTYNQIKKFLAPENNTQPQRAWKSGEFR